MHFHREPVRFLQNYQNFQPLYFALEAMDQVDAMQQKVFNAFHLQHLRLDKPDDIAAFMKANGVDPVRFMSLFNSFGTRTKVQQANQLMDTYNVDGVPTPLLDAFTAFERDEACRSRSLVEQRHRALVQSASDVIAILGEDGILKYVGPSVKAVLGYEPEESASASRR